MCQRGIETDAVAPDSDSELDLTGPGTIHARAQLRSVARLRLFHARLRARLRSAARLRLFHARRQLRL